MDEDNCMVDIARFFLDFTVDESCGKCTPCRIGTRRMLEILERITEGKGEDGDIEKLETLAKNIKASALCGLGQTAPNPVLSTLRYFRDEYEAHIYEKRCPAGHCASLLRYTIDPDKCKGCIALRPGLPRRRNFRRGKNALMSSTRPSASSAAHVWRSAVFGAVIPIESRMQKE